MPRKSQVELKWLYQYYYSTEKPERKTIVKYFNEEVLDF